ncbi:DUF3822 family protein [Aureisphaera sp. CAU 1614]|uniref:DUF3822 family protein n=1 Tax=Halomarinibacterium sedimenti TaxID=2857106 RepID=A0A9X1FP32_9FLAO|nr:DUF3822 family protein [Halomarinibacterium sedimenti]MBW2937920.1 DUF3822 family protein [Halomarinibacterium sedimenti]
MSVQVTLYGLSFLILSSESRKALLIERTFESARTPEELLEELKKAFTEEERLSQTFSKVSVIFGSHFYTLVPSSLFDESKASEYLKFNTKILTNDFVSHDLVESHDIQVVYVPFVNINNYLFEKFGNFQYFHSATVLLKHFLDREKYTIKSKVFLNVEKDWFDCLAISQGKVELCNSYPFKSPEDFLYFTLFAFEQLHLNPDQVDVVLSGNIDNPSPLYELLYRYVRNISFIEETAYTVENEENHKNFVLKVHS